MFVTAMASWGYRAMVLLNSILFDWYHAKFGIILTAFQSSASSDIPFAIAQSASQYLVLLPHYRIVNLRAQFKFCLQIPEAKIFLSWDNKYSK
jgi:hypothetical protein